MVKIEIKFMVIEDFSPTGARCLFDRRKYQFLKIFTSVIAFAQRVREVDIYIYSKFGMRLSDG
jgi:hypothetical protein